MLMLNLRTLYCIHYRMAKLNNYLSTEVCMCVCVCHVGCVQKQEIASAMDDDMASIDIVYSDPPNMFAPAGSQGMGAHAIASPTESLLQELQRTLDAYDSKAPLPLPETASGSHVHAAVGVSGLLRGADGGGRRGMGKRPKQPPSRFSGKQGRQSSVGAVGDTSRAGWAGAVGAGRGRESVFGAQAAPMVLNLEDVTASTPEVLEHELEGLSLDELVLLNRMVDTRMKQLAHH